MAKKVVWYLYFQANVTEPFNPSQIFLFYQTHLCIFFFGCFFVLVTEGEPFAPHPYHAAMINYEILY